MHFFMLSMGRTFISYELIKLYLLLRLGGNGIVDSAALLSLYCSVITYDGYQKPEFLKDSVSALSHVTKLTRSFGAQEQTFSRANMPMPEHFQEYKHSAHGGRSCAFLKSLGDSSIELKWIAMQYSHRDLSPETSVPVVSIAFSFQGEGSWATCSIIWE